MPLGQSGWWGPGLVELLFERNGIKTDTRLGSHIENFFTREPLIVGQIALADKFAKDHAFAIRRPTQPTSMYNCHGMTFASRRTGIHRPAIVRMILKEDEYQRVSDAEKTVGDIVIYVEGGDISHSGVIVEMRKTFTGHMPWVLSKWGDAPEFIHELRDCPYSQADQIEYYRIVK